MGALTEKTRAPFVGVLYLSLSAALAAALLLSLRVPAPAAARPAVTLEPETLPPEAP